MAATVNAEVANDLAINALGQRLLDMRIRSWGWYFIL